MKVMEADKYKSIFLESDWAHQKYYGWAIVSDLPGLRILHKRKYFFSRFLVLLTDEGRTAISQSIRDLGGFGRRQLCEIVIHDFGASDSVPMQIAGLQFEPIAHEDRLLNIATMVIDLSQGEETILANMSANCRNEIRKAESNGVRVDGHSTPDASLRSAFSAALGTLATKLRLKAADESIFDKMYDDGQALLFTASTDGAIRSFVHVYRAGNKAIYMYGVNPSKDNEGVGPYLQWKVMCYLKRAGTRWYDLGGVPSFESSDGIYNFKRKFGSSPVRLGVELMHRPAIIDIMIFIRNRLRHLLHV